jgi:hypothetical protein
MNVEDIVESLVEIYDQHPDGVARGSEAATQIRAIGQDLERDGGLESMLRVHRRFSQLEPVHARNLETRWNEIGHWLG